MLEENRAPTTAAILEHKADLGIAWDGDFDRCFFFDENGRFIEGYYLVGLLAQVFLDAEPGAKIVHDPRLTWNTQEIVAAAGGKAIQSMTGHAYMKESLRADKAVYGGEMSAHHYFRDFYYSDSGMVPWLLVTALMAATGKRLSQLVDERMQAFPASGEINRTIANPAALLAATRARYESAALAVENVDGLSMSFDAWRFNLRLSNTEPVVRLNVESRADEALMREKTAELLDLMSQA
jgi:phosphomannomutase